MNLYIRCHYKNSAWARNGRGTAIITPNSYRADLQIQRTVVMIDYRPYRLIDKKKKKIYKKGFITLIGIIFFIVRSI